LFNNRIVNPMTPVTIKLHLIRGPHSYLDGKLIFFVINVNV